jgi:hypothetical protein
MQYTILLLSYYRKYFFKIFYFRIKNTVRKHSRVKFVVRFDIVQC